MTTYGTATTADYDYDYAPPTEYDPAYDPSAPQSHYANGSAAGDPTALTPYVVERSRWTPLPFLVPVALTGVAWAGNGIQVLTDLGMICLALLCIVHVAVELIRFPQRFGIGGFVAFGGTFIWFCHDYFYFWFAYDGRSTPFPQWVIAKTAFLVCLLMFCMTVGLNIRSGKWMQKLVSLVPEAGSGGFYLCLLVFLFCLGILPYFLFVKQPFYIAMYRDMTGLRTGGHAEWTIGRTGLLHTGGWSAYALRLLDVGYFSGMFGAFYATLVTRNPLGKVLGWGACAFWTMMAFGTGTRGAVLAVALPAMGFLYVKYHIQAAALLRRTSVKAYVVCGVLAFGLLAIIQFQGMFRGQNAERRSWSQLEFGKPRGNHMFSEGLLAAHQIPKNVPFFGNNFLGEGAVRVLPELIFYGAIHPIPRALWHGKPVDPAWDWYNIAFTGERRNANNTTIAPGMAVGQYMRYGIAGVFEFGILFGWLLACTERVLRHANGRPIQIVTSLALSVWLFRSFRGGLGWVEFYELAVGLAALSMIVILFRPLTARR